MGEKEPDPGAAARGESQTGMVSGRESGSGMATGRTAGGGAAGGLAEASNLNLSRAGIDRGLGGVAGSGEGGAAAMTGEDDWGGHTPSAAEKWNVDATGPEVSAVGDAGSGAASIAVGEPGTNTPPVIAIGDPGVNGNISDGTPDPTPAEAAVVKAKSNISNNRESSSPSAPPPSTDTTIIKSKSNITNNRNDE